MSRLVGPIDQQSKPHSLANERHPIGCSFAINSILHLLVTQQAVRQFQLHSVTPRIDSAQRDARDHHTTNRSFGLSESRTEAKSARSSRIHMSGAATGAIRGSELASWHLTFERGVGHSILEKIRIALSGAMTSKSTLEHTSWTKLAKYPKFKGLRISRFLHPASDTWL